MIAASLLGVRSTTESGLPYLVQRRRGLVARREQRLRDAGGGRAPRRGGLQQDRYRSSRSRCSCTTPPRMSSTRSMGTTKASGAARSMRSSQSWKVCSSLQTRSRRRPPSATTPTTPAARSPSPAATPSSQTPPTPRAPSPPTRACATARRPPCASTQTDADGVSRAAFLDTVEAGDLFEWRQAEDCFVRYKVTEVQAGPDSGTVPRKLLGVEWMTYARTPAVAVPSRRSD